MTARVPGIGMTPGAVVARQTMAQHRAMARQVAGLYRAAGEKGRFSTPKGASALIRHTSAPGQKTIPLKPASSHPNNLASGKNPGNKHFHSRGKTAVGKIPHIGVGGAKSTPGTSYAGSLSKLLAQAQKSITNPTAYANAIANQQYGGSINSLKSQIAQALADNSQHITDIGDWYNQLRGTAAQGAASNASATNAAAASSDADTAGILAALGGNPMAGSVGSLGAIASAGIRGTGANQASFDQNLQTLLDAEGADQKTNQTRLGQQAVQGLRSQLTSTIGEQGAARSAAYNQGVQSRFSQLGQLQNMILGQQLAGPQLESARLANVSARQNINRNYILNATQKAQLADFINQTSGGGADKNVSQLTPQQRSQLSGYLTTGILSKQGFLNVSPSQIKSLIANRLYGIAGYDKNSPGAKQMLAATVQSLLTPTELKNWDKRHHTAYSKGIGL